MYKIKVIGIFNNMCDFHVNYLIDLLIIIDKFVLHRKFFRIRSNVHKLTDERIEGEISRFHSR